MRHDSQVESDGFYGRRLSQHLGMDGDCLLRVKREGQLAVAVTRLSCSHFIRERSAPIPSEPAFSILHQLGDLEKHSCWLAGQARYSGAFAAGTVSVIDLRDNPQCEFRGPFDAVQYYVPRNALDDFAHEHRAKPISTLRWSRDERDPYVSTLSSVLLSAVEQETTTNQLFVDQIGLSLLAHFAQTYGGMRPRDSGRSGGLAPWQERRAKEIMRARLNSQLTIADVAAECKLSASHFARSFRRSTGVAPHEFLSGLRVDEAKHLMLTTKLPLADIALICGFGDQSYFTRVFTRSVGASPGVWRRARSEG
ncbi:AraC family transcriptional regulator [Tardiphaga sp. P9-11]|jgi:AraC family transcriptional regulator|uniref:helix-turn-helix domain-containing protein n=1 Tax=Tardiphaga sp. P9-11 TaxID=2024614 RepID=UPI0011F38B03|nr:AraC family transcriptional regulator [Tardiphaga sp. P9-11]KAA0078078.1 AraC family transcriptional regulator [Tardiphaga sp. P9-11]